jgi:acyl-CoA thioesterase FadM
MSRCPLAIRFDEADARGILFYGRLLSIAHRLFEDFVVGNLVSRWEDWFLDESFIVPIRHAEADYFAPLLPGHRYEAEVVISKVGESSFEVRTRFYATETDGGALCAETRVTHVFADPAAFRKRGIPSDIRARLEAARDRPPTE